VSRKRKGTAAQECQQHVRDRANGQQRSWRVNPDGTCGGVNASRRYNSQIEQRGRRGQRTVHTTPNEGKRPPYDRISQERRGYRRSEAAREGGKSAASTGLGPVLRAKERREVECNQQPTGAKILARLKSPLQPEK